MFVIIILCNNNNITSAEIKTQKGRHLDRRTEKITHQSIFFEEMPIKESQTFLYEQTYMYNVMIPDKSVYRVMGNEAAKVVMVVVTYTEHG